jgi:hypothetical protein
MSVMQCDPLEMVWGEIDRADQLLPTLPAERRDLVKPLAQHPPST